ncbi:hypothetical protein [Stenotrophomonas sp. SY1]|uniref:hypothetical protein n=1 Tax=Stenotrophomonas sp. SY1 TaxID=477235 RepID=UPI001E4FEEA4|nr:hypothetical protein [Stenotrophomonas sp. SY1]MCD9088126.1 hypothetical protein [Stenotrophomonas sp. SY1]
MPVNYSISLPDPAKARGSDPRLSFTASGAETFAEQLQAALRTTELFDRWKAVQDEPDDVDPSLAAVDPQAVVTGQQADLRINLQAITSLPGDIFKHRLRLLAGTNWEMRDVR